MTASKRKNENVDDVANQLTKMVIVGNHGEKENNVNQYPPTVLLTTIERMKKLSEQWEQERPVGFIANKSMNENKPYDTIAQSIGSVIDNNKTDIEIEESLLEQAEEIKSNLSSKIEQAQDLRKKETGVIGELSAQLSNFHDQRQNLLRQIEELDDQQHLSQEKIAMYQAEASQELDMILDVEEQQKRQVPRLKMTISLYASTTGIKWDFTDPDLLSGQVEIPSQQSFNIFRIDPRDFSPVETADMLWTFMEGNEEQ